MRKKSEEIIEIWEIQKRKPKDLIDYESNPRKITKEKFNKLKERIQSQGFRVPPSITIDGRILAGHQRIRAMIDFGLGGNEIPVAIANRKLTDEEEKEIVVSDNLSWGEFDFDILANEYERDWLIDLGMDEGMLGGAEFCPEETDGDDDIPNQDDIPEITVLGDLYELGSHRLICGDSTRIDEVERLLNRVKVDLIYTDPPYGINEPTNRTSRKKFINSGLAKYKDYDSIIGDDSIDTALQAFSVCEILSKVICYWGGNYYAHKLPPSPCWIVWDKRVDDNNRDLNSDCELAYIKHPSKKSVRIFRHLWKGMIKQSEHGQSRVHPTQKPIALAEWVFQELAPKSKIVLDLFGGSGSTLIACERAAKSAYLVEISPKYCDVIVKRYVDFCNKNEKKPVIKRNGEIFKDFDL